MAAGFQLRGHAVKRAHQIANLVGGADLNAVIESSAGNFLGGLRQRRHWARHQLGQKKREPGSSKEHHDCQQKQHAHVSAAKSLAAAAKL